MNLTTWELIENCLYTFFALKNAENDYFHQRLGCAALKYWWKYTTPVGEPNVKLMSGG